MTLYECSIPVLIRALTNLRHILDLGHQHAAEKKIDETVFTSSRMFPDMFELARQVQIACDNAKGCGARLSGIENPVYQDTETSFAELQARIDKTIDFLKSIPAERIDGQEQKHIEFRAGPNELNFTGINYLHQWVIPNVYFHSTTVYNLLRKNGVVVGKKDFLGPQS